MKKNEIINLLEKKILENYKRGEEAQSRYLKDNRYDVVDSMKHFGIMAELIDVLVEIKGTSLDYEYERLFGKDNN